jgi:hypothetical protein
MSAISDSRAIEPSPPLPHPNRQARGGLFVLATEVRDDG